LYDQIIRRYGELDGRDLLEPLLSRALKGKVALVSSFGTESAVMLHMVSQIDKSVPVIFLDTGKLPWQTLFYRSKLIDFLGLTDIRTVHPDTDDLRQHDPRGELHGSDPDFCCHIRKTVPLDKALGGFAAWISGRKRFHGAGRSVIPALQVEDGRLKIEPLARFTAKDMTAYAKHYNLPPHPLLAEGYRSIGCTPCSSKGGSEDNPRAGRWAGRGKTECGIHWTANGRALRIGRDLGQGI
jgi:phosphoadenosine phosphosulfate reductase